jgi:hypothetical protein
MPPSASSPCCQRHALSPDKIGKTKCGPLEDDDLERMLARIQRAIVDHGPEALRAGGGKRGMLALIPEVLSLRHAPPPPRDRPDRETLGRTLHDLLKEVSDEPQDAATFSWTEECEELREDYRNVAERMWSFFEAYATTSIQPIDRESRAVGPVEQV